MKLLRVLVAAALVTGLTTSCTKKVDDKDNSLNIVLRENVKGLDPIMANDRYSSMVIMNIYDGLLQYHYLKRPYELVPALAESLPTVTDKGLTYTFKIRKGVMFQDNAAFPNGKGRELEANDFIYSWKRLADPANQSDGFWIFDGKVKGLNEWAAALKTGKADYTTAIEGLQAPDKYTLVIKLKEPYYQLNWVLAMPFAMVVPHEAVEKYGKEFLNNPVGTGPYALESWVRNSKIILKKNASYYDEKYPSDGEASDKTDGFLADAGQKLPFADKINFTELIEDQPRWLNFLKGNFDWAEIPNDNFEGTIKNNQLIPDLSSKGMKLVISPELDVTYVGINLTDPILGKSKLLRQAMSLAHDSNTYIQKFYNGRAIQAQGPLPPGIDSYDANFKNPYQQYSVEKAKEVLKKAGYPDGKGLPEFMFESLSDSKARQTAEFFAQSMASIGIKVKINSNTWPQFQEKIKASKAQFFGIAWGADYPDAQNFYQLFYSKNVSPGPNDTNFKNAEFDKVYEAALKLPPGDARNKLYQKLRDIVVEEVPWIYIGHRTTYFVQQGWFSNFKPHDMTYQYKYWKVDPKKRAELKPKL